MVGEDLVDHPGLNKVVGRIGLRGVNEPRNHLSRAVEFRHGVDLVLIKELLHEDPVDLLTYPAVLPVDQVVDAFAAGEYDGLEVPETVIGVACDYVRRVVPFAQHLSVCRVSEGKCVVGEEPVLSVVGRGEVVQGESSLSRASQIYLSWHLPGRLVLLVRVDREIER